jgi:hypothetical protein
MQKSLCQTISSFYFYKKFLIKCLAFLVFNIDYLLIIHTHILLH